VTAPPVVPSWIRLAAGVWVVGFLFVFFSQELPNNRPVTRWDVWSAVPFVLMDAVDPPQTETSLPRGLQYLGQRLPLWGMAGLILAGAWGWGTVIVARLLRDSDWTSLERHYFAGLLGLSAISLLVLAFGLIGFLASIPLTILLVGGFVAGLMAHRNTLTRHAVPTTSSARSCCRL
jgi:hypothetical protein